MKVALRFFLVALIFININSFPLIEISKKKFYDAGFIMSLAMLGCLLSRTDDDNFYLKLVLCTGAGIYYAFLGERI